VGVAPNVGVVAAALRERIFSGLHLGALREGDQLPTVRDLARELAVDPRAVLAAYRQLEDEGLVELRARSGAYVATTARRTGERLPAVDTWVVAVVVEALARGIPAGVFVERLRRALSGGQLRAACLECNVDQLAALCAELGTDYGLATEAVDTADLAAAPLPDGLVRADLLVTTRFHTGEVARVARRLGKPWVALPIRPDLFAEIAGGLRDGAVYVVVSDVRFADKLRRVFADARGAEHLRPLLYGRDDLAAIPRGAPVYVTLPVREALATSPLHAPLLARAVPVARVTPPHGAADLVELIVRTNLAAAAREVPSDVP